MKTAVSLPDPLFRTAEKTARQLRMSRSQLYAVAIAEFLERRSSSKITESLNSIYAETPAALDAGLHAAQLKSLPDAHDKW